MKFAHSIIVNAVPEWIDQYVDYDHLKKIVYQAEKDIVEKQNEDYKIEDDKAEGGLNRKATLFGFPHRKDTVSSSNELEALETRENDFFLGELEKQLDKTTKFFVKKEQEFLSDADALNAEFDSFGIPLPEGDAIFLTQRTPKTNDLEKLDSALDEDNNISKDPYPTATSSAANDSDFKNLAEASNSNSNSNTNTAYSVADTLKEPLPNVLDRKESDRPAEYPSFGNNLSPATATTTASAYRGPTRSNTVSAANFRSRHSSKLERSLSHRSSMGGYKEDRPPTRIVQAMGLQFGRRRDSHISFRQADDAKQFNQYYNFRVRCAATYISLTELKDYANANRTAFDKILKKWDKVTGSNLREAYFDKIVQNAEPFRADRVAHIDQVQQNVLSIYAAVFTMGNLHNAELELKMHMRDHITFERTSLWKDLVGKERQTLDAHASIPKSGITIPKLNLFVSYSNIINIVGLLISLLLYIILMCINTMGEKEASKCLALLVFAALMWAFETIPLYATAMLIPLMIVPMHIVRDSDGDVIDATSAAKLVFSAMFSDTIMVLLGGFSIAAALSKHGIAKAFASTVLSKAGSRPRWVVLVNMCLAYFLCMWISNVATPVLCFSLVEPIMRTLRSNSSVAPCLILGIALASCIGGLSSPISSPQNIITISLMDPNPGWGNWFAGAIPCGIVTILTTWLCLLAYFRPDRDTPHLNVIKARELSRPSISQLWVCFICLATIALWCAETSLNDFFGDNGTIAAIPFVLLFGTKMLNKTDLNNFLWSVVVLAQGGMALGYAVESSGLLDVIGHQISRNVGGLSPLAIVFIFGMLILCFATFVSHTVAALIILPIVKQVGQQIHGANADVMVMVSGLVCSVAMGLPVSGFPNMNAIMMEDPTGKPYLTIKDFILCGIPASCIAAVLTICLGYGIVSGVIH